MSLVGLLKGKRLEFVLLGVVCIVVGVLVARVLWLRPVGSICLLNSYRELDLDSGVEKLVFVWGFNSTVRLDYADVYYDYLNGTAPQILQPIPLDSVEYYVGDVLNLKLTITDMSIKELTGEFIFCFYRDGGSFRLAVPVPFASQNVHGGNQK